MTLAVLKETTHWQGVKRQPNHVYLMDGSKVIAYLKWGEGDPFYFKVPRPMNKKGRQFIVLKDNPFPEYTVSTDRIPVEGSHGTTYWVDVSDWSCSCKGYTFRGQCRHIEQLKSERGE